MSLEENSQEPISPNSAKLNLAERVYFFKIMFLVGCLGFGLIIQAVLNAPFFQKRGLQIPYTVMVMALSLLVGALLSFTGKMDEIYNNFTIANANPKLIMYAFFPILIFDSAFRMEAHSVMKAFSQIAILASVGLLVTASIVGGIMYFIMNHVRGYACWTIPIAMVFGSILSATDPVAVVSLLNDLGAPHHLVTLTEGESLFNDGVAIIVYKIFLHVAERQEPSNKTQCSNDSHHDNLEQHGTNASKHGGDTPFPDLWRFVARELFGLVLSPAIGVCVGKVCELLLKQIFNQEVREKSIILICVYGTYFLCERIGVSGVLALVVLGIWLSLKKHSISPKSLKDINKFWDFFSYWANTVIFILAGLVIARPIVNHEELIDYCYCIFVYLLINIGRAISILLLYPVVARLGYGLKKTEATVLVWGGLRGAIALLLTLEMAQECFIVSSVEYSRNISDKALLYVAGSVALTLLINATTFGTALKFFKINVLCRHKVAAMQMHVKKLQTVQKSTITKLRADRFLAKANWTKVERITRLHDPYKNSLCTDQNTLLVKPLEQMKVSELLENRDVMRERVLQVEKGSYWKQFNKGLMTHWSISALSDAVEHAAEQGRDGVAIDDVVQRWKVDKFWFFVRRLVQSAYDQFLKKQHYVECANIPDRLLALNRRLCSLKMKLFMYALVLLDVGLFVMETKKVKIDIRVSKLHIDLQPFWLELVRFFICTVFVTYTAICMSIMKRRFFQLAENIFKLTFAVIYLACGSCLLFKLCKPESFPSIVEALKVLEVIACFHLLEILFILPYAAPRFLHIVNSRVHENFGLSYDATKAFIVAMEDTIEHLQQIIHDKDSTCEVEAKCRQKHLEAILLLAELHAKEPGAAVSITTKQAAQYCLNVVQEALNETKENGILGEDEYLAFARSLDDAMSVAQRIKPWIAPLPPRAHLRHLTWLAQSGALTAVYTMGDIRQLAKGRILFEQNECCDGLYIVLDGLIKEETTFRREEETMVPSGTCIGIVELITDEKYTATVTAVVKTTIYFVPLWSAKKILQDHPALKTAIIKEYAMQKANQLLRTLNESQAWTENKLRKMIDCGGLHIMQEGEEMESCNTYTYLLLVHGAVMGKSSDTVSQYGCTHGVPVRLPYGNKIILTSQQNHSWLFGIFDKEFEGSEDCRKRLSIFDVSKSLKSRPKED